jgi:hypothetical protein
MKRQIKKSDSIILKNNLQYSKTSDRTKIHDALLLEQNGICAYTETFLAGRTDSKDIEHFNPTLKDTSADSYENWFLVKHQWNIEKSKKWANFQPILHPIDEDFEKRVFYQNGYYDFKIGDTEAENLIKLLKLDDLGLAEERINYIALHKEDIAELGLSAQTHFDRLLKRKPNQVYFIRAIEEEFKIKIDFNLINPFIS